MYFYNIFIWCYKVDIFHIKLINLIKIQLTTTLEVLIFFLETKGVTDEIKVFTVMRSRTSSRLIVSKRLIISQLVQKMS
jgi:hypothetical protein